MLKEFRFSNFSSFRDESVLSMEAVGLKDLKSVPRKEGSSKLLPVAAIYGKNGGGKTNILWAFSTAVSFILNAQQTQHESASIPVRPFLLDEESAQKPTFFEFVYSMDGIRYWYAFSATREKIISESLSHAPKGQKALVFSRKGQDFVFRDNPEKKKRMMISELVSENQLFFSVASGMNDADCKRAMRWFRKSLFNGNAYDDFREQFSINVENPDILQEISNYARAADVGIDRIDVSTREVISDSMEDITTGLPDDMPETLQTALKTFLVSVSSISGNRTMQKAIKAVSQHKVSTGNENSKVFPLDMSYESDGTKRLIALVPAIVRTLDCGGVLMMDELEQGMHPVLVEMIISKFQNPQTNPNNAQLIFTTHSTELLDKPILRRDQIYLADKSRKTGVSTLYSVSDFSMPTRENVRKAYFAGKFGAFPDIEIEEVE